MASNSSSVKVYKEGLLLKRSRGLHSNKRLKFQERYCKLTSGSLDYYDPKKRVGLANEMRAVWKHLFPVPLPVMQLALSSADR